MRTSPQQKEEEREKIVADESAVADHSTAAVCEKSSTEQELPSVAQELPSYHRLDRARRTGLITARDSSASSRSNDHSEVLRGAPRADDAVATAIRKNEITHLFFASYVFRGSELTQDKAHGLLEKCGAHILAVVCEDGGGSGDFIMEQTGDAWQTWKSPQQIH